MADEKIEAVLHNAVAAGLSKMIEDAGAQEVVIGFGAFALQQYADGKFAVLYGSAMQASLGEEVALKLFQIYARQRLRDLSDGTTTAEVAFHLPGNGTVQ